jgi:hypothetical protein
MKTAKFYLAAALIAATVMTSCSNDDEAVNGNERVEVKFSSAQASVDTRVTDNQWDGGEHIGIYMLKGNYALTSGNISEGVSNREYKNGAAAQQATASFTPESDIIYYPANQSGSVVKVKFIAYYPYEAVLNGSTTFTRDINVSNQASQSAIDFLYAPVDDEYDKTSGAVELPFKHKLVKLEFVIENGDGVSAALTGLTVEITKQETESTLNLTDGSVPVSDGGSADITAKTAGNGESSEAIVLPLSDTKDVRFIFTNTEGEEFTGTVPDAAWAGGNKYTYNVKLNKIAAVITGTIENWGTGTGGSVEAK